ncbi:glucokinase [Paucibacter sp. TC2R-5]|uniref:glucokinase n=1 Tax=Paucibacter sp. TC2R-5 TaxID=2893555 RepID=UPI0021E4F864|nr:glucokinase [Paucibacter sp. TC2R-5]MCV2360762.1 glucokinase [Paucibacter sp. TC2R-5]
MSLNASASLYPRLLGDVGGTHARFAWGEDADGAVADIVSYKCAEQASLQEAIARYLAEQGKPRPRACAIGIANPIVGDTVRMTNHHWSFSIAQLKQSLGVQRLAVLNDFTALALSLPALRPEQLRQIGGGSAVAGEALAVLGAGTGLGVAGLLPVGVAGIASQGGNGSYAPISGEGGHASLAAIDEQEAAVVNCLRQRFGHASAERALSGPGLLNLYQAAAQLAGRPAPLTSPQALIAAAREQRDPDCLAALDLFFRFLGSFAGNLALTYGARGGVYVGGGVVPRLLPELAASRFRERFEAKGRFANYLAAVPTFVIDAAVSPALIGASRALDAAALG